jgi:intein/homing endonuclease
MDIHRRELLRKFLQGSGFVFTGGLIGNHFINGTPKGLSGNTMQPLQCGWIDDSDARQSFLKAQKKPFLAQQNGAIRGSGKGKVVLLHKLFEDVTGGPLVPHLQAIGDCYYAGTLVTMANGSRTSIEQIKVGEIVLSHLGHPQKVTRTIRKPFNKGMVRFKADGCIEDIVCTPDHLILVNDGGWKPAGRLSLDDHVFIQRYTGPAKEKTWDLLDISPDAEVRDTKLRAKNSSKWVNRFVHLDANLAYVIGAYLAEGGCSRAKGVEQKPGKWCRVDFNLGSTEEVFANRIATSMEQIFGIKCNVYSVPSKPTVKYVRCQSKAVAEFFKHLMPGTTYTKEVPSDILIASKEAQLECLLGWLEGDGSCPGRKQRKTKRYPRCSGVSVSSSLITGMSRLANCCGFRPKMTKVKLQENRTQAYRINFDVNDTAKLYPGITDRIYPERLPNPLGLKRKLKSVSTISKVATTVYCLDVEEDHSFIANGYTGHNCVGHGFSLGVDVLTAVRIAMFGKPERWITKAATEIIYAGSRVEVGGRRIRGDGSMGTWAAEFIRDWGVLLRKAYLDGKYDYTEYSGPLSRKLGKSGVPDDLEPLCREHPVKTCALVNSWEECRDAVANGYPVVMCSNTGFRTTRDKDGFLRRTRRPWFHAMLIHGIDDSYRRPGGLVQNSWGENWVDGPTRHDQPMGSFWADARTIDRAMKQGDSIALSGYVGYPRVEIPDYRIW